MSLWQSCSILFQDIVTLVLQIAVAFTALAFFDYLYQWWDYERQLKMSKQEIKEEYKQTDSALWRRRAPGPGGRSPPRRRRIPVHESLLDILIIINISLSIVILMVTMTISEALEFSIFPSLLLIQSWWRRPWRRRSRPPAGFCPGAPGPAAR